MGLTDPLISYWFTVRFHIGPGVIAPPMAGAFALTGVSALATERLTQRVGTIRSVIWARLAGVALLGALLLIPTYRLALLAYLSTATHIHVDHGE